MMKKYFIIPLNAPAYQNLLKKRESEKKFAKAFDKFADENNIKTNSFYAREDRLAIIPCKEDKQAYSNEFLIYIALKSLQNTVRA